jgi:hypothetical protein
MKIIYSETTYKQYVLPYRLTGPRYLILHLSCRWRIYLYFLKTVTIVYFYANGLESNLFPSLGEFFLSFRHQLLLLLLLLSWRNRDGNLQTFRLIER